MLIECVIKRKDGSLVEINGNQYLFNSTSTDERHLCEVKDAQHIERLLSIKEAYREACRDVVAKPAIKVDTPVNEDAPLGESITQQEELIAEARSLGIKANSNWSIKKLIADIATAKGT